MANYKTGAQRYNNRMDKIMDKARQDPNSGVYIKNKSVKKAIAKKMAKVTFDKIPSNRVPMNKSNVSGKLIGSGRLIGSKKQMDQLRDQLYEDQKREEAEDLEWVRKLNIINNKHNK